MISADKAREFAAKHFPNAPEKLAEHIDVVVRESRMNGCDGWCLTTGDRAIIRINSNQVQSRKRFTLAHELGHLILGVPANVGETYADMLRSDSAEERRVNKLASELLLPTQVVKSSLPDLPVVADALKKLAKKANISELATAIRVCNVAGEIGLTNAYVVQFDGDQVRWQWSDTLRGMDDKIAAWLLDESRKSAPIAFRHQRKQGDVIVASSIENPYFGSVTLFVQLLPHEQGMKISRPERRKALEAVLFAGGAKLQQRVSGLIGAHKGRISEMSEQQALGDFWGRNLKKLANTPLNSDDGREYIRLRISEWF